MPVWAAPKATPVTFHKDVAPLLQKQCTIPNAPRFDFNWQLFYYLEKPKLLPKGTRIECTAHFDNSANHRGNPDPGSEVKWGDQSWEEMMIGWFELSVDAGTNPKDVFKKKTAGSD